jgi:hypothetical protein
MVIALGSFISLLARHFTQYACILALPPLCICYETYLTWDSNVNSIIILLLIGLGRTFYFFVKSRMNSFITIKKSACMLIGNKNELHKLDYIGPLARL